MSPCDVCGACTVRGKGLKMRRIYLQWYTKMFSHCPTYLANFAPLVKSQCKGAPAKNAILWTCKLTPHTQYVTMEPNC